MKKILLAVMLVAAFGMFAMAENAKGPAIHAANGKGDASFHGQSGWGNMPASAAKLLFYGGDGNPSDPNQDGFANGNTSLVADTTTYGAVTSPKSKVVATGVLFNQVPTCDEFTCTGTVFDPATGTYDIRTGVSEGVGGTSVASGSGPQTATATGRTYGYFGGSEAEYSTSVLFTKPLTPAEGVTYWLNESPQCTDASNSNCATEQFFANNSPEGTNSINGKYQPSYQIFFNSAFFGYTWENWCTLLGTGNATICQDLSFGVSGT